MQVSIIIVNYNTLKLTKNTIESILEKTSKIEYEIILIDNNSSDGSRDFFSREYYSKKIKFIQSEANLGFGKANNLGIDLAKGKYIFLLNSDTLLINNSIKILYDFMEENKDTGICGGNLYDENQIPAHSYNIIPEWWFDIYEVYKKIYLKAFNKRLDYNYTNKPQKVGYITGADMFIRKSVLDEVGSFDPDFFMYFEETELSSRIRKAGYSIYSVPEAKIVHLEGKSFTFKETRFRMMTESKYRYFEKVYGKKNVYLSYILSQIKYLLFPTKESIKKLKINRSEFIKFEKNIQGIDNY
ncbi:glycosyltransferase family 2 protein [uncultured Cetobacterium sp.]|uniref:glycosyltransferase family 2 protein n=1 Tax=uncultured Cetobacterium sp. TaxID=527638 RepID=UPI0025FC20F5|nr:glycosyltransferase family 2 protein [uncultured Cetobacterium sp.]